jgi:hypothetical protein
MSTCLSAGGVLCFACDVQATVSNGNLLSNSLKPLVVMQHANLTVVASTFAHNHAPQAENSNTQQQPGGALITYDSATLLLQDSLLHNNSAGVGGALIVSQQSRVNIRGSFSRNFANDQGEFCRPWLMSAVRQNLCFDSMCSVATSCLLIDLCAMLAISAVHAYTLSAFWGVYGLPPDA